MWKHYFGPNARIIGADIHPKCKAVEDTHTSYWAGYGGGRGRRGTFMEYAKKLVDQLNAWHSRNTRFKVDEFTRTTRSIHFYDSMIVFEKDEMSAPEKRRIGVPTFDEPIAFGPSPVRRVARRILHRGG